MKKLIFAVIFILTSLTVFAQIEPAVKEGNFNVYHRYYDNIKEYYVTFTDVDSVDLVSGLTSDTWAWDDIATSTSSAPSFRYAYTTTSANDTLMCLLQGYDPLTGNYNTLDSLGGIVIYSTTDGGTTTYGTVSLSTNGYSPYVRLLIKRPSATNDQADNGTFEISIYAPPAVTVDPKWWK
jgi:hypothetical protein